MEVRQAVQTAKKFVADLYTDEDDPVKHIGVEEVVFNEDENAWSITVGFFRLWDQETKPPGITEILHNASKAETARWKKRSFKVIQVDDDTGKVKSMTHFLMPSSG